MIEYPKIQSIRITAKHNTFKKGNPVFQSNPDLQDKGMLTYVSRKTGFVLLLKVETRYGCVNKVVTVFTVYNIHQTFSVVK